MSVLLIFYFILLKFIYFERESQSERERVHNHGEGQRERERQNLKQAPHCQPRARRGARTHEARDHDLSRSRRLNQLSHPGAPKLPFLKCTFNFFFFNLFRETAGRSRERERERETESQAGSALLVQGLMRGLNPRAMRSQPELRSRVGLLTDWATQGPPQVQISK